MNEVPNRNERDIWEEIRDMEVCEEMADNIPNPQVIDPTAIPAFENDITFDRKLRGYDRRQVDDYIESLTVDYNDICAKCDELEKENQGLRRALAKLDDPQKETHADS